MLDTKKKQLIQSLKIEGRIKSETVEKAFLAIPREAFIPPPLKQYAYTDTPLEIGYGQTISAPHMVAIMCEALDIHPGHSILEIGAGSGYHAAIVSHLSGKTGHVYAVERFASLAKKAQKNLDTIGITNVKVVIGDGSLGLSQYAPYDRIYVTCAAPKIPPPLIDQLKDKGKLLIPIGKLICTLHLIEKHGIKVTKKNLGGCAFVPLVGKHGH